MTNDKSAKTPAIFLDRDGVINEDTGFTHKVDDFRVMPGVFESLRLLRSEGFKLFVVTNQSGIGRGYYTAEDFGRLNEHMLGVLGKEGVSVDEVYFCPHKPEDSCECRKPSAFFIKQAERDFNLDLPSSWTIGDRLSDIEFGRNAGCRGVLLDSKYSREATSFKLDNLSDATEFIIRNKAYRHDVFDRTKLRILPLGSRQSKSNIEEIAISPDSQDFSLVQSEGLEKIAQAVVRARQDGRPIIFSFGAHLIRNGLGLVLGRMVEEGYITHLATNGAGSIHDWEFAFQGKTSEDVRKYVGEGQFGIWDETGKYINLALIEGAKGNLGYGESVGRMIHEENLEGRDLKHPFKKYSLQDAAFSNGIPFTVHPGFGYDIIYTHPLSDGASIGKVSQTDFLRFANSVSNLEGGVYISVGSAIMSPMIFEKSLSMGRNTAQQKSGDIRDFTLAVNDIQEGNWDFSKGIEPPKTDPAYFLRFCKTFDRMGAREMHYVQADNRDFVLSLYKNIVSRQKS